MSASELIARTINKDPVGNGTPRTVLGTRDGALYTCEYILNKAMEAKIFTAQLGTLTTPVTFRVGADADQPEMVIDVPAGVVIVPVHIEVHLEDAAGTDTEVIAQANPALCGAGTSTLGALLSTRIGSGVSSACTFRYTYSGNCTLPANTVEIMHTGYAFADATTNPRPVFIWDVRHNTPVVIQGPGSLVIYIDGTGTAPAGYAKASFMEFTADAI
jgi:hypothetical protein